MGKVLVTGASGFLGYHVAKLLNQQGTRPRVLELPGSDPEVLGRLDVERCDGHLEDPRAVEAACAGVDTLLHMAFKVSAGGDPATVAQMRRINVQGTERLLDIAAAGGVSRAVVASSALAVGMNDQPAPLDETADWTRHDPGLPYATFRREAEQAALARTRPGFAVVAVCPSLTMGPDDPSGAPANKLLEALIRNWLSFTLPIGFGCLDVRDFASGAVLAAERGRPGQRYLLSGHNVTMSQLLEQAAAVAGVRAPRREAPKALLHAIVAIVELFCRITGKPAPITRDVLRLIGRYAWYDAARAQSELGWEPRPLRATLEDTVGWLRGRRAGSGAS